MTKISRDLAGGSGVGTPLHPRESIFTTGNLAANLAEVSIPCDGCSIVSLDLRGTFVGTVAVQGTVDGTNWELIPIRPRNTGKFLLAVTTAGLWQASCAGYQKVRALMTPHTSGSATAVLLASNALFDDFASRGGITTDLGTVTAAAGVAATLTLAAPGVGLRHYLTYIRITRFAAALLTAAATPVLVTTTNIPGALVFSMPADAAAQGTVFVYQEDFAYPIAASAQNTATTIVAPLTANVIWRISAGFFVGT